MKATDLINSYERVQRLKAHAVLEYVKTLAYCDPKASHLAVTALHLKRMLEDKTLYKGGMDTVVDDLYIDIDKYMKEKGLYETGRD